MNEKDIKPHIESLKKEPSLDGILNFTQAIFNQLPENTNEKGTPSQKSQLNADNLNSLMTAVQGFVNPTTLSLLSKTLNKSDSKKEVASTPGLENEVRQLLEEFKDVKGQLDIMKSELAENNMRLEKLESEVQYLRRRRRR